MAKNKLVSDRTAEEIDLRVKRVIERLGHPEPPLDLSTVRDLLKINLAYFQADDPGLLEETLVRLKIGTQRTLKSAIALSEAVRKWSLRALFLPSQNRILLEKTLPPPKLRWNEAHEIGHSLLPWHLETMLGDNATTLSPACHARIEAEANYAGGRLLFLQGHFDQRAQDANLSIDDVLSLSGVFANSISSTMWRFIEVRGKTMPMVGMLSAHPNPKARKKGFDPTQPCRHFIQSQAFAKQFWKIGEVELFERVTGYAGYRWRGPLGGDEVVLNDDNGEPHIFSFETFWNGHDALTLGVYSKPAAIIVPVLARA